MMPISRETPIDLEWAAVNDAGAALVCTRGYERRNSKSRLVSRVELQDAETGTSLASDTLDWAVRCALTNDNVAYAGDRRGGAEDPSFVLRYDFAEESATEIALPMSQVWALEVSNDGRYLACAGLGVDGFGPGADDTWVYETVALDSPPVQTPNPHRSNIDVLKWGDADWFLSQSEMSRDYHFQFAAQLPGTKKPIWRGKGRGAVVVGKELVLWSIDGLTLELWDPHEKKPRIHGEITMDGQPIVTPNFSETPHNMAAINGGSHVVFPAGDELWVVELERLEVCARFRPRPWSYHGAATASLYASPNGKYLAYWCSYHNRGVVIEAGQLLE